MYLYKDKKTQFVSNYICVTIYVIILVGFSLGYLKNII